MEYPRNTAPMILSQSLTLDLVDLAGGTTSIEAEVEYDPRHPYAVTTTFMTGPDQVRWTFGRDLLSAGLHEPVGDGDVHVRPHLDAAGRAVVVIELSSPSGIARVQGRWGDLSEFVQRMHDSVAPGSESQHLDLDATIMSILEAEAA